ncbi:unnamed protein product, partial [Notodromas monacha]
TRAYFSPGTGSRRPYLLDPVPEGVHMGAEGRFVDGYLICSFNQSFDTFVEGHSFNLGSERYHLQIAAGEMNTTTEVMGFHHERYSMSPRLNLTSAELTLEPTTLDSFYEGCGVTAGCMGCNQAYSCSGSESCISSKNCASMLRYSVADGHYGFLFYRRASSEDNWISIALSENKGMGPSSSATICAPMGGDEGVRPQSYWIKGEEDPIPIENEVEGLIEDSTGSFDDGLLWCSFSRDAITTVEGKEFDLLNSKFFLTVSGAPSYHGPKKAVSGAPVDFNKITGPLADNKWKLEAHAICMILAWLGSASCGILTARYYKKSWSEKEMCGKAIWDRKKKKTVADQRRSADHVLLETLLQVHVANMLATVALSVMGFAFILSELGEFEKGTHPIVGLISLILAFVQPFMALARCEPDHPKRPIFNWAHFIVGNSAHILAVTNIFLAVDMEEGGLRLPTVSYYFLIPAVVVYVLAHLGLSVLAPRQAKKQNGGDNAGEKLRQGLLFLQIIVSWTMALILCLIITGDLKVDPDGKKFA